MKRQERCVVQGRWFPLSAGGNEEVLGFPAHGQALRSQPAELGGTGV